MAANDFINNTLLSSDTSDYTLITQILNIYRYGSLDVPEDYVDHIRHVKPEFTVQFSALEFMTTGPGRYVRAADFDAIKKIFDGDLGTPIELLDQLQVLLNDSSKTVFSKDDLTSSGLFTEGDFLLVTKQTSIDTGSDDYAVRAFIFQTQQFEIADSIMLDLTHGEFNLTNVEVFPTRTGDNFDFNSTNDWTQLGNDFLLEPSFDPYGLGELDGEDVKINFEYAGQGKLYNTYVEGDYIAEEASAPPTVSDVVGIANFGVQILGVISDLEDARVITFDEDGRYLAYGTHGEDSSIIDVIAPGGGIPYPVHIVAGDGTDELSGYAYADLLEGNDGSDTIKGKKGDDVLIGGEGEDTLQGGNGDDYLYGHLMDAEDQENPNANGPADDYAADTLEGGNGADHLFGGGGEDILKGGNGADVLYGHSLSGDGDDNARDVLYGNQGDDRLYGQGGNDLLLGGKHNDELYGGSGHDYLVGGTGDDKIFGEEGTDYLQGGAGADELHGGDGFDSIGYEESSSGIILNFQNGVGVGSGGDAEGDTIESIEYITGSDYADTITGWSDDGYEGPAYSFLFEGGKGNDSLEWIGGGRIEFWGQRGADTLSVSSQIEMARFAFNAGNGKDELYLEGQAFGEFSGGNGVDKIFAVAPKSSSEFGSAWTALGSGVSALEFFAGEAEFEDYSDKTVDRFYLDNWELTFDLDEAAFEAGGYGEYLFFLEQSDGTIQINYEGTIGAAGEFVGDALGDIAITMWLSPQYLDDNANVVQDLSFVAYDQNIDVELVSFDIIGFEHGDYGISFNIPSSTQSSPSSTQLISHSENPMRMERLLKDELGEEGSFDLALLEMPHKEGLSRTLFDPEFVDEHRSVVTLGEPVAEMDLASFDYDVLIADAYLGDTLAQHDWA